MCAKGPLTTWLNPPRAMSWNATPRGRRLSRIHERRSGKMAGLPGVGVNALLRSEACPITATLVVVRRV